MSLMTAVLASPVGVFRRILAFGKFAGSRDDSEPQLHNAEQIQEMILKAGFKMDGYAQAYFNAMKDAESTAFAYGKSPEEGLKVQVLYFFSNCKARTPEQKAVKKKLLAWAGYKGYRG